MKQQDEAREEVQMPFLEKTSLNTETLIRTDQHRLQQYLQFFDICHPVTSKLNEQDIASRLPSDIAYSTEQFTSHLVIKITRHSKNYQLIDLEVRLGHFTFNRVSIIHISTTSPVHDVRNCGSGAFCTVYRCEFDGNILAFKCFSHQRIKCQDNSTSILEKVIQQYCLLRIASCFGVGPKMFDLFGFDIMIHPGCIQICMECCDPFPPKYMPKIKEYEQQLKQHMLTLHKLHIIHHDIKMENICFSLAFNSLVFIDFGLSKIVKEELGFKTLTKYRGTLYHCGDQMTQLFQKGLSERHYVDLYYNDMIGLKKTFEDLRLDQFKYDIAFISQIRKDTDKMQKNLTAFYKIYVIKHQIFQGKYNFEIIEQLSFTFLCQLFQLTHSLRFSLGIKRLRHFLSKLINKIDIDFGEISFLLIKDNSINPIQSKKDQYYFDESNETTINDLKKAAIHNVTDYFLNCSAPFHQLLIFLKIPVIKSISIEDYFCLLAKAIQINMSTVKIAQLNEVCLVAQRMSEQFYAIRSDTKYLNQQSPCFFLASEFLFKTAFKHQLKGKYFDVYCCIINNIFIFHMISTQQLLQYYDTLLRLPLFFETKLLVVIYFLSGLIWMYTNISSLDLYEKIQQKINLLNSKYLSSQELLTPSQMQILQEILTRKVSFKRNNLDSLKKNVSKKTEMQIRMWLVNRQILKLRVNLINEQEINNLQSELSFHKNTILEYYHFSFIILYYLRDDWQRLDQLISKYSKVFRGRLNNNFILILSHVKLIRSQIYQKMEDKISILQTIANCKHSFTNFVICNQLDYFIKMYWLKFNKCKKELKADILRLIVNSHNRLARIDAQQPLKDSFVSLTKQTLKQAEIAKRYFYEVGEEMKDMPSKESDKYHQLIRMRQSLEFETGKVQTQQKLFSVLTLAALLIKKRQIGKALEVAKFLYRITSFIQIQQVNRLKMLNFIFYYIIQENDCRGFLKYRQGNRHLYFDYANILRNKEIEELFIGNFSVLADTIALMYRYKFTQVSGLIQRVSKKVLNFNCKSSSLKYSDANDIAFYKIKRQTKYQLNLYQLEQQLNLLDNPYNVFPRLQILMLKHKQRITLTNYIHMFDALKFVDIFARELVLQKLCPHFMFFYWVGLSSRRRRKLMIKSFNYNFFILSQRQLKRLLVSPSTLKMLKISENIEKMNSLEKVLNRYNEIVQWKTKISRISVKVSYMSLCFYHGKA